MSQEMLVIIMLYMYDITFIFITNQQSRAYNHLKKEIKQFPRDAQLANSRAVLEFLHFAFQLYW